MNNFLEEIERERAARLEEIRSNPKALSPMHRPGSVYVRKNSNVDSDCDYFTCPGCGLELYSSYVHAWAGIECEKCGCTFSAADEDAMLWDFDVLPGKS